MKKILFYTFAMVFVLALGVAYAAEWNGVTDFKGLTYDIGPVAIPEAAMEGVSAGGMREDDAGLILGNGLTDFSGKTYDSIPSLVIEPAVIEGEHAGGMREEAPAKQVFKPAFLLLISAEKIGEHSHCVTSCSVKASTLPVIHSAWSPLTEILMTTRTSQASGFLGLCSS